MNKEFNQSFRRKRRGIDLRIRNQRSTFHLRNLRNLRM